MGARYYPGDTGRFISQDPVALALGDWRTVQDKTGGQINLYLRNPQTQNSYSYTANNPLKFVDKNGEFLQYVAALFLPNVAYAPDVGQENQTNTQLETSIVVAGIASPSGKAQQAANQTVKAANAVKGKAYDSFSAFKRDVGPAGQGRDWHHLVEQNPTNKLQFGERALQNTDNLVSIPKDLHRKISGFYSSKQRFSAPDTVRNFISRQSFQKQLDFARKTLNRIEKELKRRKKD